MSRFESWRLRLKLGGKREREVARLRIARRLRREERAGLDLIRVAAARALIGIPAGVLGPRVEIASDGTHAPITQDVREVAELVRQRELAELDVAGVLERDRVRPEH